MSAGARTRARQRLANRGAGKREGVFTGKVLPVVVSVVLAVVTFFLGQIAAQNKQSADDQRVSVENRRRLFVSTTEQFGIYVTQLSRLRTVTRTQIQMHCMLREAEDRLAGMAKEPEAPQVRKSELELKRKIEELRSEMEKVEVRKERYVRGRDDAKDKLSGYFEQARLFFGPASVVAISEYEAFDRRHSALHVWELPPLEDWRWHASDVFDHMRSEIKHDEERLKPALSWFLPFARQ
jgi:hypothetical protein